MHTLNRWSTKISKTALHSEIKSDNDVQPNESVYVHNVDRAFARICLNYYVSSQSHGREAAMNERV